MFKVFRRNVQDDRARRASSIVEGKEAFPPPGIYRIAVVECIAYGEREQGRILVLQCSIAYGEIHKDIKNLNIEHKQFVQFKNLADFRTIWLTEALIH